MKKVLRIIIEVFKDVLHEIAWVLGGALYPMAVFFEIILPYAMLLIGVSCYEMRGKFAIGGEVFIPLFVLFIVDFAKRCANKIGRGNDVPIPERRFTEIDSDGEVSIDSSRLQELILYMGNLEDWIERKGLN